jgi:hypothetical protein
MLDNRRPPAEQTFEKLNPATGQGQSIVNAARALTIRIHRARKMVAGRPPLEFGDARYFLDRYSDVRTLPSLRLHSNDGPILQTLADPRPQLLAPFDVQLPEFFTIPADDGFSDRRRDAYTARESERI